MLLFSLLGKVPAMLKYTENVQVLARRKVFPWLPRVPVRDMGSGSGGQERMKLWDFQGDFLLIVLCTTFLLLVLCFNLSHAPSNSLPVPVKLNYFFSVFFLSILCSLSSDILEICLLCLCQASVILLPYLANQSIHFANSENTNPEWGTSTPKSAPWLWSMHTGLLNYNKW